MKVLITAEHFAPDFQGGGEYIVLETARHLQARGVEVGALTTGDPAVESYEGVPTIRLPIHTYRLNLAVRRIVRAARDVDLIHSFNYHACFPSFLAGRILKKPVVCGILGLFGNAWREMRGPVIGRMYQAIERFTVRLPFARIMFLSDYSREIGVRMGVQRSRTEVNQPGIQLEAYMPPDVKEDVVLFVGKYDVRKGLDDILVVARRLPHVKFRLVGWGGSGDEWKRQAPSNVEFAQFARGQELRAHFARARIFLFPSRAETFGLALVEAMASGCAVISSIPLPFAGQAVAAGDIPTLTAAVDRLWNDRALTTQMGLENTTFAGVYSWQRHTTQLLRIYDSVLSAAEPSSEAVTEEK